MSFQPVIPASGLSGWRFLQRTYESQFSAFQSGPAIVRDIDYFSKNIASVNSAEDLVSDRRLLRVALGAFGLESDINNKFFIQKILEDGTLNDDALSNRLSDKRYHEFSAAFGFGALEISPVKFSDFPQSIADRYSQQEFEIAVGQQDDTMRIALFAQRELGNIASSDMSDNAKWFTIMGQPPLRSMFETTFNLPASFGQIDLDQQLGVFKDRAGAQFGNSTVSQFLQPDILDDLITQYVARSQLSAFNAVASPGSIALTLLQSSQG